MHQFDVNDVTMERNNSEDMKRRMERELHQRTCTEKSLHGSLEFLQRKGESEASSLAYFL